MKKILAAFAALSLCMGFSPLHIHAEYSEQLSSEEKSELPSLFKRMNPQKTIPRYSFTLLI